jgi:hypothetical protein
MHGADLSDRGRGVTRLSLALELALKLSLPIGGGGITRLIDGSDLVTDLTRQFVAEISVIA